MIYLGSCHCGEIQFEVDAPESVEVENCNCSICRMSGFLHLIVPIKNFRLIQGESSLTSYRFNTGVAQHFFCQYCGIKPFYVPRSNPDGMDVNLWCLKTQPRHVSIVDFDGQNWEQHAHTLASKSQ